MLDSLVIKQVEKEKGYCSETIKNFNQELINMILILKNKNVLDIKDVTKLKNHCHCFYSEYSIKYTSPLLPRSSIYFNDLCALDNLSKLDYILEHLNNNSLEYNRLKLKFGLDKTYYLLECLEKLI